MYIPREAARELVNLESIDIAGVMDVVHGITGRVNGTHCLVYETPDTSQLQLYQRWVSL